MDNSNPLHFFINCAEESIQAEGLNDVDDFLAEFAHVEADVPELVPKKNEFVRSLDEIDISPLPSSPYWTNSSTQGLTYGAFDKEKLQALEGVDNVIAGLPSVSLAFAKLTEFINTMDNVITRVNNFPKTTTHTEIANASVYIKNELTERKKRLLHGTTKKTANTTTKLKWLGQVNVMGTLFYHLLKGQDGGEPYISGTVEQVKHMLVDNFVDSDGHDLSKTTLDTIFMPSRSEKRANIGDRIELPNKKPKK